MTSAEADPHRASARRGAGGGGILAETALQRTGHLLRDPKLVDQPRDDETAAVNVEGGGAIVPVELNAGQRNGRVLGLQLLTGPAASGAHLIGVAEALAQRVGSRIESHGAIHGNGGHGDLLGWKSK